MAETGIHVQAIFWLHQALLSFFKNRPDVLVASDQFWYWIEGDPKTKLAPDVMIVPGVGNHYRRTFNSWEEGAIPFAVFEMASESTWRNDENEKYALLESLGVKEYFLFDPEGLYLSSPLKGYRLNNSAYRRIFPKQGEVESELGFNLRPEGMMLRVIDRQTGQPIPTYEEQAARFEEQAARLLDEQRRAEALATEVERLKALLAQQAPASGTQP
jgi:Uma2 family endonuclease